MVVGGNLMLVEEERPSTHLPGQVGTERPIWEDTMALGALE